jgi:hypothetical protein
MFPRRPDREANMRASFAWLYFLSAGMAMALTIGPAVSDECCARTIPRVVYALPPVPTVIPPTGYVLDPSDAARPVYPVGPYVGAFGAATYARPTYSEGRYAYADSYPYTDDPYNYGAYRPPAYGARLYGPPGPAAGYDPPGLGYYQSLYIRPWGAPPYTAYRYRPAPSAKIIHLQPKE